MKRRFIRIQSILLLGLLSLTLFSCKDRKKGKDDIQRIVVACNFPESGPLKFYGEYVRNGINMAMDELKDSLAAAKMDIFYDFQDNESSSNGAITVFNGQKAKGFDIYFSGVTNQTVAILEPVKSTGKPHFIISFDPFNIEKGDNLYRPYLDMDKEGKCNN